MFQKRKKSQNQEPHKGCLQLVEYAFLSITIFTAIVAFFSLLVWSLISLSVALRVYSIKTEPQKLTNGQFLQVEYPNIALGSSDPVNITLTISGSAKLGEIEFQIQLPTGLTLIQPVDQAGKEIAIITIEEPEKMTNPQEFTLGVINSQAIWDFRQIKTQSVSVQSSSLDSPENFPIGIESVPWMSARGLVNNTFNDRSPLILLVTGFLSGAGALMFQYVKLQRDNARESRQKRENEFRDQLDKNLLVTLGRFANMDQDLREGSEYSIYKQLVDEYGWERRLHQIILAALKNHDNFEAEQAGGVLAGLCQKFSNENVTDQEDQFKQSKSLARFCNLACSDDPKRQVLTLDDARCLQTVYKRWPELKPVVTRLIHDFTSSMANLRVIYDVLAPINDGQLLRDANIHHVIDDLINQLKNGQEENQDALDAAEKINDLLIQDVYWRKLWSGKERKLTDKVQRWLFGHFIESADPNFSLGSEYAELDVTLREPAVEHPVFRQINGSSSVIVFGEEGMGKTASALWLANQHQKQTRTEIFPVYAPFESGMDLRHWMVETIARALISFIADNPRKFISSSDARKAAMGRLMFWQAQGVEVLRLNLYSSPFNNASSDIQQVLDHIKEFKTKNSQTKMKMTKDEMLNYLYLARPDTFDQIYFLWDIRSSSSHEEVVNKIREMAGLADHLARQNVFIKIFAPLWTKQQVLGDLGGIRCASDLTWSKAQLSELVEKKMKEKFNTLWDKSVDDPVGMIVNAANQSPRRLMKLLLHLTDYVDEHVQQEEKTLNKSDFKQVRLSLVEKK